MEYKGRAQCLVVRDGKILQVKHSHGAEEYFCSPGGGIEKGETPEQAALRELREECLVDGRVIKKLSEWPDPFDGNTIFYTFQVDIGGQIPMLGKDPEFTEDPILAEVRWMALDEICERDRAYLWASGLLCIEQFWDELSSWSDDISYPGRKQL